MANPTFNRYSLIIAIFLLFSFKAFSQIRLGEWTAQTSMYQISSALLYENSVWAATTGGAFKYNLENKEFDFYRNVDRLFTSNLRSIAISPNGYIYMGGGDGTLEIVSPLGTVQHILDIRNSGFVNPTIFDIHFANEVCYISGGFGLAVFDPIKRVFIEDVKRMGNFPQNTAVNSTILAQNQVWCATAQGLAKAPISLVIADRFIWENYSAKPAERSQSVALTDVLEFEDQIYALSNTEIFRFENDSLVQIFSMFKPDETYNYITSFFVFDNKLMLSDRYSIRDINGNILPLELPAEITFVNSISDKLIIGLRNYGLMVYSFGEVEYILPNSPISNSFIDVHVDRNDNIYAATGRNNANGLMVYKNGIWKNYNSKNTENFSNDAVMAVKSHPTDGRIFVSTFGGGQCIGTPNDSTFDFVAFNKNNEPLPSLDAVGNFIIPGRTAIAQNGTVWTTIWSAANRATLFSNEGGNNINILNSCGGLHYFDIDIDFSNTKWLASYSADKQDPISVSTHGLLYYNERNPSNTSDDICGNINTGNNSSLRNNGVICVKVDKQGLVWYGLTNGAGVIVNPSSVLGNSNTVIRQINALADINVNSIEVDALNNKWFGTNNGVFVLNSDATEILYHLTTQNSPLPVNDIYSLSFNSTNGKMYMGAASGLYSVQTSAIEPLSSYDIKFFPQPYNINSDPELVITGLAAETDIRILTVSGELVRNIKTGSRETVWDGRDEYGNKVGTGVYIVVAVSGIASDNAVGKFAVISK